ncbi:MAG: phage terminase large subunit [Acetobacteraceae bacterium]
MPRSPGRLQGLVPDGHDPGPSRGTIRADLLAWANHVLGADGLAPARHHRLLIAQLQAVAEGTIDRLMVLMPPGSAKSTYSSVLFPIWWFSHHPASSVIAASHTSDLAKHFARQARSLVVEHAPALGFELQGGERAASRWATSARGQYFATGVRGPITGRRADLAIIDDPIRTLADAESPRQRNHLWDWYRSDLITRLKPGGRVVIVMTRWHQDDLAGRLLDRHPGEWTVLRLPALAEADDPMGRLAGEALWPEWEDEAALLRKRDEVGERVWSALFQQTPRPSQGSLFKISRIEMIAAVPEPAAGVIVRAWDLAATAADGRNDPDYTVGVKLLRDAAGRLIVLDILRQRTSALEVELALLATAAADGKSVLISLPEDPGQAGKSQVLSYVRKLAGYQVVTSRETGSKLTRALPVAAQIEAGNMALIHAAWNHDFIEELRDFPYGRKDDQVDALARGFSLAAEMTAPARRIAVPFLAR